MKLVLIENGQVASVRAVNPLAPIDVMPGQWVEVTALSVCPSAGWCASHDAVSGWEFAPPDHAAEDAKAKAEQMRVVASQVQAHLDAQAVALGYDNIFTGVTYATEPAVPKFQNDGTALRAWRSLVWAKCYEVLAEIDAGTREPVDADQLLALLPVFSQGQA